MIYENTDWAALDSCFALVVAPVTPRVKAALLRIVRAFALSPTYAFQIWTYLEQAQVPSRLPCSVISHTDYSYLSSGNGDEIHEAVAGWVAL